MKLVRESKDFIIVFLEDFGFRGEVMGIRER